LSYAVHDSGHDWTSRTFYEGTDSGHNWTSRTFYGGTNRSFRRNTVYGLYPPEIETGIKGLIQIHTISYF